MDKELSLTNQLVSMYVSHMHAVVYMYLHVCGACVYMCVCGVCVWVCTPEANAEFLP